jgi:hypothetical protein
LKTGALQLPSRRELLLEPISKLPAPKSPGAVYWGTIKSVNGSKLTVALRTGKILQVDLSEAAKNGTAVNPAVGLAVYLNGALDNKGTLQARVMSRAKSPASWGVDSAK